MQSINAEYFGETETGDQIPVVNVFRKTNQGIFHFYSSELFFVDAEEVQHMRHVDMLWPLWNILDLT